MAATRQTVRKAWGGIEPPTVFCTNNDSSTSPVIGAFESINL